jgi:hypothetical protein
MTPLKYCWIFFITGFFISCAGPQYTDSNGKLIPFGVNSILIDITEEEKELVMSHIKDHLIEMGYEIDHTDHDELLIVTDYMDLEYRGSKIHRLLYLNIRVVDVEDRSFLLFTGHYRGGGSYDTKQTDLGFTVPVYVLEDRKGYNRIYHPKYSGPNERIAWEEFLQVAKSFHSDLNFATL